MLKRYFTWLKEVLPRSVWESLEPELNFFEENLPHLRGAQKTWVVWLAIVRWLVGLTTRGVYLCAMQPLLSAILGASSPLLAKTKRQDKEGVGTPELSVLLATSFLLHTMTILLKTSRETSQSDSAVNIGEEIWIEFQKGYEKSIAEKKIET